MSNNDPHERPRALATATVAGRRQILRAAAAGAVLLAGRKGFAAPRLDSGPPLRLVVPFPEGGSSYFLAEVLARAMSADLGRRLRIQVRSGHFGINGLRELQGRTDGSTLYLGSIITNSMTPVFHTAEIPFDYAEVVEPVTKLALFPTIFMVNASSKARSVKDFLARLKQGSSTLIYGTDFLGTTSDIDAIELARVSGLKLAYRATSGALGILADLMANRIDVTWLNAVTAVQNRGKYKPLAVLGPYRLLDFPGVPTLAQAGYGRIGAPFWQGLFVTRGTSAKTLQTLYAAAVRAMATPETRAALHRMDATVELSSSPAAFSQEIAREMVLWRSMKRELFSIPRI